MMRSFISTFWIIPTLMFWYCFDAKGPQDPKQFMIFWETLKGGRAGIISALKHFIAYLLQIKQEMLVKGRLEIHQFLWVQGSLTIPKKSCPHIMSAACGERGVRNPLNLAVSCEKSICLHLFPSLLVIEKFYRRYELIRILLPLSHWCGKLKVVEKMSDRNVDKSQTWVLVWGMG